MPGEEGSALLEDGEGLLEDGFALLSVGSAQKTESIKARHRVCSSCEGSAPPRGLDPLSAFVVLSP